MKTYLLQLFFKDSRSAEGGVQQQTIRIEQFIKDVNFESQLKAGVLPKCVDNKNSELTFDWYLQQSFLEQKSPNTDEPIVPMLLIPLFKIKDQQGQYVDYLAFEQCNINDVTIYYDNYYVGYRNQFQEVVNSIKLQVGDKKSVNLEEHTFIRKNGFVIFKDTNSNAAMLYFGLFIDFKIFNSPDCELSILFKKFVLNDEQYTKEAIQTDTINPENVSIDIEFDPDEIAVAFGILFPNQDVEIGYQEYFLSPNRSLGKHLNIKLTGHLEKDELYFRVFKDMGIKEDEEIYMTLAKK